MLAHKILYAMKCCMEELPDDKLLPVLKTLMCIWTGDFNKYQQRKNELEEIFRREIQDE